MERVGGNESVNWISNGEPMETSTAVNASGELPDSKVIVDETSDLSEADWRAKEFLADDSRLSELLPEGKPTGINKFFEKHKKLRYLAVGALFTGGIATAVGGAVGGAAGLVGSVVAVGAIGTIFAPVGAVLAIILTASVFTGTASILLGMAGTAVGTVAAMRGHTLLTSKAKFNKQEFQEKLKALGLNEDTVKKATKEAQKHIKRAHRENSMDSKVRNKRVELAFNVKYDPNLTQNSKRQLLNLLNEEQVPQPAINKLFERRGTWETHVEREMELAKQLDSGEGELIKKLENFGIPKDKLQKSELKSSYKKRCDDLMKEIVERYEKNSENLSKREKKVITDFSTSKTPMKATAIHDLLSISISTTAKKENELDAIEKIMGRVLTALSEESKKVD